MKMLHAVCKYVINVRNCGRIYLLHDLSGCCKHAFCINNLIQTVCVTCNNLHPVQRVY